MNLLRSSPVSGAVKSLLDIGASPFATEVDRLVVDTPLPSQTTPALPVVPDGVFDSFLELRAGENTQTIRETIALLLNSIIASFVEKVVLPSLREVQSGVGVLNYESLRKTHAEWFKHEGVAEPNVHKAVRTGVVVLCWLQSGKRSVGAQGATRPLPALCELFASLNYTVCNPTRGVESVAAVERVFADFSALLLRLGVLPREASTSERLGDWVVHLPFWAMDAHAIGISLRMGTLLRQTRATLSPLGRGTIIPDTIASLQEQGIFHASDTFYKVSPYFRSVTSGGKSAVQAGEGHGPRKEFFDLVAAAMCQPFSPEEEPRGAVVATAEVGSFEVHLKHTASALIPPLRPGDRIILQLPHTRVRHTPTITQVGSLSSEETKLTVSDRFDEPCTNCSISFARAHIPPFTINDGAAHAWFNPQALQQSPVVASNLFTLVGWMMANAIANGVLFPIPLPALVFKMLRQWPNYTPSEQDMKDLDESHAHTFRQIRSASPDDLKEMVGMDDLDATTTADEYINVLVQRYLKEDVERAVGHMHTVLERTGLTKTAPWCAVSPDDLQALICGRGDDGMSDFNMQEEYTVVFDESFGAHSHNEKLKDVFWAVMGELSAKEKRQLITFVTGRRWLPPVKGSETIKLELPHTPMTVADHEAILRRLPQAHTCTNTIEIPNYLDAIVALESPQLHSKGFIMDSDKEDTWDGFDAARKADIVRRAKDVMRDKFMWCLAEGNGYDLDEVTESRADARSIAPVVRPRTAGVQQVLAAASRASTADVFSGSDRKSSTSSDPQRSHSNNRVPVTRPPPSNEDLYGDGDDDDDDDEFAAPAEDVAAAPMGSSAPLVADDPSNSNSFDVPTPKVPSSYGNGNARGYSRHNSSGGFTASSVMVAPAAGFGEATYGDTDSSAEFEVPAEPDQPAIAAGIGHADSFDTPNVGGFLVRPLGAVRTDGQSPPRGSSFSSLSQRQSAPAMPLSGEQQGRENPMMGGAPTTTRTSPGVPIATSDPTKDELDDLLKEFNV